MRKKLYDPLSVEPFKLSRSKIELFCECPCCFYLDRKLGVAQPGGLPFNLNSAVDHLLKKEFDAYREKGAPHPLMVRNKIDAIPFKHDKLDDWRMNQRGLSYLHEPTRFLVAGAIDEVWINPAGELIVVDFKATSKTGELGINADWQVSYKRQMEIYQWLFKKNGFKVSPIGYFVYCNGRKDVSEFRERLQFDISVIPYLGNDDWIEFQLGEIFTVLSGSKCPSPSISCTFCNYRILATSVANG